MSVENTIADEIIELFSSHGNMQSDVEDALGLMRGHLHKKYTGKMIDALTSYRSNVIKNPSSEVKLLKAFKPFVHESAHGRIDELVETLQTYNVLMEMRNEFGKTLVGSCEANDSFEAQTIPRGNNARLNVSIHPDGIYDIDEQCRINNYRGKPGFGNMAGVMMLLAIMNGTQ